MFCSKCGTEIPEGASVCPNCGAAASSIEATNEVTKNNKPPKKKMSKGKKALVIVGVIAALLIFIGIIGTIGSEGGSDVRTLPPAPKQTLTQMQLRPKKAINPAPARAVRHPFRRQKP